MVSPDRVTVCQPVLMSTKEGDVNVPWLSWLRRPTVITTLTSEDREFESLWDSYFLEYLFSINKRRLGDRGYG